jgi:hypothetical protein
VDRLQSSESIEVHTVYPVTAPRRILEAIATRRDLSSTKLAHRIVTFPVWNTGKLLEVVDPLLPFFHL